MSDYRIGHDAVAAQRFGQRDHHREQHRLDHVDAVQRWRCAVLADEVAYRPAGEGAQRLVAVINSAGKDVVLGVELVAHGGVLGALAGEDEHDLGALTGQMMLGQKGVGLAGAQSIQPSQQLRVDVLGGRWCGDSRAIRVVGARGGQAVGQIARIDVGVVDEVLV
ncbi:hypothetical protein MSIMFI_05380 [Mycobacterium simulans]|nr:hypothetical protein MSIMFI_05380 [Mycobacterium simulans]